MNCTDLCNVDDLSKVLTLGQMKFDESINIKKMKERSIPLFDFF